MIAAQPEQRAGVASLVPLAWVPFAPGARCWCYVGRDARENAVAPGSGPAMWTAAVSVAWLWPLAQQLPGCIIVAGVTVEVVGSGVKLRVHDVDLLKSGRSA